MISFALRGIVADLDETTTDEPWHPAVVLLLEVDGAFARVILPSRVLDGKQELLCAGRPVWVRGEVKESLRGLWHVASEVRFMGLMH
jgi:hypothetical protein